MYTQYNRHMQALHTKKSFSIIILIIIKKKITQKGLTLLLFFTHFLIQVRND